MRDARDWGLWIAIWIECLAVGVLLGMLFHWYIGG